jgi:hypothetical protein
MMVIKILPNGDSSGVKFADNPTVPKAEMVSNRSLLISAFSVKVSKKKIRKIKNIEATTIDNDLFTNSHDILLLNRFTLFRFVTTAQKARIIMAKVVTLIPPPVDPEDAPINEGHHKH